MLSLLIPNFQHWTGFGDNFFNSFLQQFKDAINSLSPSPTDSYQLGERNTIVTCLPNSGSRHNAPMSPHTLTQIVRNGFYSYSTENLVVHFQFIFFCDYWFWMISNHSIIFYQFLIFQFKLISKKDTTFLCCDQCPKRSFMLLRSWYTGTFFYERLYEHNTKSNWFLSFKYFAQCLYVKH